MPKKYGSMICSPSIEKIGFIALAISQAFLGGQSGCGCNLWDKPRNRCCFPFGNLHFFLIIKLLTSVSLDGVIYRWLLNLNSMLSCLYQDCSLIGSCRHLSIDLGELRHRNHFKKKKNSLSVAICYIISIALFTTNLWHK